MSRVLLALQACVFAAQAAVVEVDLIFPRNDTYAPGPFMPVVFAIQNAAMAASLDMVILWDIIQRADPGGPDRRSGIINLQDFNMTAANPLFVENYAQRLNGTEDDWAVRFGLSFANCSKSAGGLTKVTRNSESRTLLFSTKPGAPAPNLEQNPGKCVNSTGVAINVADTLPIPLTELHMVNSKTESCLVLASPPTAEGNPCAVTLNETTAAGILRNYCGPDTAIPCLPASSAPAQAIPILVSWFLPMFAGLVLYLSV